MVVGTEGARRARRMFALRARIWAAGAHWGAHTPLGPGIAGWSAEDQVAACGHVFAAMGHSILR